MVLDCRAAFDWEAVSGPEVEAELQAAELQLEELAAVRFVVESAVAGFAAVGYQAQWSRRR